MENIKKSFFETKIKPAILYVGSIGAVFTTIAYIVIIFILIFGFKATTLSQTLIFSIVNAVVGLVIMQLLKIQGIDFAKNEPENQVILKKYNTTRTKKKRTHSLNYFWIYSSIKDVLIKGLVIMVSTAGLIYIVVVGSQDYNLLLLAFANILMFICFGLLALVNSYDFFNEKYIPYVVEKLAKAEMEVNNESEIAKIMEVVEKECFEQTNDTTSSYSGNNLLVTSDSANDTIPNNTQCLVHGNSDECNCVLGRTIHTSSDVTTGVHNSTKETV